MTFKRTLDFNLQFTLSFLFGFFLFWLKNYKEFVLLLFQRNFINITLIRSLENFRCLPTIRK